MSHQSQASPFGTTKNCSISLLQKFACSSGYLALSDMVQNYCIQSRGSINHKYVVFNSHYRDVAILLVYKNWLNIRDEREKYITSCQPTRLLDVTMSKPLYTRSYESLMN